MKKKKILIISHDFVKKVNIRIYEELNKKKNIKILCVRPKKLIIKNRIFSSDYRLKNSKVSLIESKVNYSNLRFLFFKDTFRILNMFKPNEVLIHNDPVSLQVFFVIFFSIFYKSNFKISCISHENKIIQYPNNSNLKKNFRSLLLSFFNYFIKYKIEKILCISKQIKNNYDYLGYENKTYLIPLGYDEKIFKKKKTNKKNFTISYFGRISYEKGVHVLIKALKKIDFDFEFMLDVSHIDDINYFKKLLKNLRKILKPNKINLIKCNHTEIADFMSRSDLVILPSIYQEQYGRVIQESVACGSLVIGSRVGAIPEIIVDRDLLFEKNNHQQLAFKINKLKNKNFYNKKIKKLYKRVCNERTLSKQLQALENLF